MRIKNGMFPEEIPFDRHNNGAATIFTFVLNDGVQDNLFMRLDKSGVLLPVFAKVMRKIKVIKNEKEVCYSFCPKRLGETGWYTDDESQILYYHDATSNISLAMGWKNGLPASLSSEIPKLWHTLPTESGEEWGLEYALNGPFHLDPGRTHIIFDEQNSELFGKFGKALGKALCAYSDYVEKNAPDRKKEHYHALWNVLSTGLDDVNSKGTHKEQVLKNLHTDGRGLSFWLKNSDVITYGIFESWSAPVTNIAEWKYCSLIDYTNFIRVITSLDVCNLGAVSPSTGKKISFFRILCEGYK